MKRVQIADRLHQSVLRRSYKTGIRIFEFQESDPNIYRICQNRVNCQLYTRLTEPMFGADPNCCIYRLWNVSNLLDIF